MANPVVVARRPEVRPVNEPRKPRYAYARVVNQVLSALLDSSLKLLWHEHLVLNDGGGCHAGAGILAQRLGLSAQTVENGRRELVRLGLLRKIDHGRGRTATWLPVLPPGCAPQTVKPGVAELARLAERLEQHIRTVRGGVADYASPRESGVRDDAASGVAGEATLPPRRTPLWRRQLRHSPGDPRAQSGVADDATVTRDRGVMSSDEKILITGDESARAPNSNGNCVNHRDRPSVGIVSHRSLCRECFDA